MSGSFSSEIAGINLTVLCPVAKISRDPDPAYLPFIDTRKNPPDIEVEVKLELGNLPDLSGLERVFDSGQSWSLFRDSDEYLLSLCPPALGQGPVWIARFGRFPVKVTVYCGEMLISTHEGSSVISNPVRYPLDQLLLMYVLAWKEGALFHAAGMEMHGKGYAFLGRSGAGKSTLARSFWGSALCEVLSDDRVVVRKFGERFDIFGTPWPGEAGAALNKCSPLSGLFFLSHGSENLIRDLSRGEAVERLMPVTSIPWYDSELMARVFDFCDDLCSGVPCYELSFRPDSGVVGFVSEFVSR